MQHRIRIRVNNVGQQHRKTGGNVKTFRRKSKPVDLKCTIPDCTKEIQKAVPTEMYAEVVTFVAGSLEAGGLPGYPEVLVSLK